MFLSYMYLCKKFPWTWNNIFSCKSRSKRVELKVKLMLNDLDHCWKKEPPNCIFFFITAKEGQGKKKTLPIGLYIYIHVGTQIIYSVYFFQVSVCVYVCGCSCVCWGGVGLRDNFVCWGRQGVWGIFLIILLCEFNIFEYSHHRWWDGLNLPSPQLPSIVVFIKID